MLKYIFIEIILLLQSLRVPLPEVAMLFFLRLHQQSLA